MRKMGWLKCPAGGSRPASRLAFVSEAQARSVPGVGRGGHCNHLARRKMQPHASHAAIHDSRRIAVIGYTRLWRTVPVQSICRSADHGEPLRQF